MIDLTEHTTGGISENITGVKSFYLKYPSYVNLHGMCHRMFLHMLLIELGVLCYVTS